MTNPRFFDRRAVEAGLDYAECIVAVRNAMRELSLQGREQPLRQIVETAPGKLFALMPGGLGDGRPFGAKVITAFGDPCRPGRSAHRGVVILFDPQTGEVRAIADAGAITEIRTACATAVATGALARKDARTLGLFGCGALAATHLRALMLVRPIDTVFVWGRDSDKVAAFVRQAAVETGLDVRAADAREAAAADIVTTITGASTPVLFGDWIAPGAHINLVGSSYAGPVEVDTPLVVDSRYIVDSRPSALAAAAEFIVAKAEGAVGDDHIAGEIGEVLGGVVEGRQSPDQVTAYKSLGHIVQDLAAIELLMKARGPSCSEPPS